MVSINSNKNNNNNNDIVGGDYYSRYFEKGKKKDTLILNMGPQHPSTHGVLRILLELDGEYIVRAEPVIGYIHRMHEKMAENRTYLQYVPNMGRVDYLDAMAWNWAYVGAVEKLAAIQVPKRAEYIRVIVAELNRISSHLVWWGAFLLDLGAFTPIMYSFDDREQILDLLQSLSGSRLTYSYFHFGGVNKDITSSFKDKALAFIKRMKSRLPMYKGLVTDNYILRKRLEGVGIISLDMARRYGATGPVLRGCGQKYDIRKAEPYSIYNQLKYEIAANDKCDAMARYLVRLAEIEQSLLIIEQAIYHMPDGKYRLSKVPRQVRPPMGDVYFAVEGARGKIGINVHSNGGKQAYRVKLRSPGYSNLSLLGELAQGVLLADVVAILGSLDLVIPEIDR